MRWCVVEAKAMNIIKDKREVVHGNFPRKNEWGFILVECPFFAAHFKHTQLTWTVPKYVIPSFPLKSLDFACRVWLFNSQVRLVYSPYRWTLQDLQLIFRMQFCRHSKSLVTVLLPITWPINTWSKWIIKGNKKLRGCILFYSYQYINFTN